MNLDRKTQIKAQCGPRTKIVAHPWYTRLNFINVLRTAFTREDPRSVKKTVYVISIFFCFWDL